MKLAYLFLYIFLSIPYSMLSQEENQSFHGVFYKASLATTLAINEEYTLHNDDSGPFFNFSALFINNTLGYQFDGRASIGLNVEYNWHSQQGLHFLPAYLSVQYNILKNDTDFFIRGAYGSLLDINNDFEKGNMYKAGVGIHAYDDDFKNSWLIGVDFTRKRFGYRNLEGLSSVSIFLEFMLF